MDIGIPGWVGLMGSGVGVIGEGVMWRIVGWALRGGPQGREVGQEFVEV